MEDQLTKTDIPSPDNDSYEKSEEENVLNFGDIVQI